MWTLGTFIVVLLFVIILRKPIKKYPVLFYAIAFAYSLLFLMGTLDLLPRNIALKLSIPMHRGAVGFSFFIIVMYIGVFDRDTSVRRYLGPIRKELSIIGWFLLMAHVIVYVTNYASTVIYRPDAIKGTLLISLGLAVILSILLFVLGITSFEFIKKKMTAKTWFKIQRWSYLFYALAYAHTLFIFVPPALKGSKPAIISLAVYSVIFIVYFVLRLAKANRDKKARELQPSQALG